MILPGVWTCGYSHSLSHSLACKDEVRSPGGNRRDLEARKDVVDRSCRGVGCSRDSLCQIGGCFRWGFDTGRFRNEGLAQANQHIGRSNSVESLANGYRGWGCLQD